MILFRAFVFYKSRFFTSIIVCQYFCGDNIDPAFIQSPPMLSSIFPRCRSVTRLDSSVLLLFSTRFSFPEQRLNGEATTRTIRRGFVRYWVAVSSSFLLCLVFISSAFAIAFVIRYRSTVEKNNVCLVDVFPTVSFSRSTQLQSFVLSEWQCRKHLENLSGQSAIRANWFQVRILRLLAIIISY